MMTQAGAPSGPGSAAANGYHPHNPHSHAQAILGPHLLAGPPHGHPHQHHAQHQQSHLQQHHQHAAVAAAMQAHAAAAQMQAQAQFLTDHTGLIHQVAASNNPNNPNASLLAAVAAAAAANGASPGAVAATANGLLAPQQRTDRLPVSQYLHSPIIILDLSTLL